MADHEQRLMVVELRKIDQQKDQPGLQQHAQQQAAKELVRGLAHGSKNPWGLRSAAQLLQKAPDGLREYTGIIIPSRPIACRCWSTGCSVPSVLAVIRCTMFTPVLEQVRRLVDLELPPQIRI